MPAIGKQQYVWDASEFLKGMTSGPQMNDGGFTTETDGVNLTKTQGVIYAPAAAVDSDTDTRLTGNIIASGNDHNLSSPTNKLLVTDDGKFYTYNGTKIPAAALGTDSSNTYTKGYTDMISFGGGGSPRSYITTKQRIVEWTGASTFDFASAGSATWTFTNSTYRHPALVYENNAFYGDGNLLLRQTAVGGALATILTLSQDQVIIALGIDPGSGRMLISTTSFHDDGGTLAKASKLHWYDGFSSKTTKVVVIDEPIYGFWPVGGTVFAGYGQNLGYINGAGISFLRKLENVSVDTDQFPYKNSFCNIGRNLFVIDGDKILSYSEIIPGQKIFYYVYQNKINSNKLKCIFDAGNNKLGFGVATSKFYTVDLTSTSSLDGLDLYTAWITFPRAINPRKVTLEFVDALGAITHTDVSFKDQANKAAGVAMTAQAGAVSTPYSVDFLGFKNDNVEPIMSCQLNITTDTNNKGFKRAILFYDWAE